MVWQRIKDAFGGDDAPATPTVRDVFRTFAALAAEGVPIKTVVEPRSVAATYGWTRQEIAQYGYKIHSMRSMHHSVINLGWIWLAGTVTQNGRRQEYLFPAVTIPIRASKSDTSYSTSFTGDFQLSPLLADPIARFDLARRLDTETGLGDLKSLFVFRGGTLHGPEKWVDLDALEPWVQDFADAMGLGRVELSMAHPTFAEATHKDGITCHPGFALFESRTSTRRKRVYDLTALDRLPSVIGTAFNALYGSEPTSRELERPEVASFRPLSLRQRSIAKRLTDSSLSVLSGAPGTGKTHLISVTAADAVARGESVLVLAGSPKAVDVLVEHFAETPGPPPITFGGSRYGDRIHKELVDIAAMINTTFEVDQAPIDAASEHDSRARRIRHEFEVLHAASEFQKDPDARARVEAELAEVGDLNELQELLDGEQDSSFVPRERRIAKRLGTHIGAEERLKRLWVGQDALARDENPPFSLAEALDELAVNEVSAAKAGGDLLTQHWISRLGNEDEKVLRRIAKALLVSRYERRQLLTEIDPERLTQAAPLWVGSLDDVDDVLPTIVGLFDLVIIDEASQIDQVAGAHALIRAKRALICGDPQQIGFEQYLSDAEVDQVKEACNTAALPLTPKDLSLFDVAAAKFGVEVLDEHFRSAPHVIEFSSRRFYDGGLYTATRHPLNEAADHIDVSIVEGVRSRVLESSQLGGNQAEVDECFRVLLHYLDRGERSIGIVSPFAEQAEAIEALLLERFATEEIAESLRVGTVRDFQGDECEVMIVSYGVGSDEADSAWESVNDPKFFNVMATRAREQVHILSSNPKPPGLAGEYIRWEEPLVDLVRDEGSTDPWVSTVADVLRSADIPVRVGYRVGRYVIDLVAGDAEHAVAIDCTMHPDGVDAHIDRALLLRRTGWRTTDAFPEKWRYRIDLLVDELTEQFPDLGP